MGAIEQKENTGFFLEMIDAVLGHRDRLRENPIMTLIIERMSPLTNDGSLVDNLLEWAIYQPPVFMQVLPLAGATSPITLSGSVLQENTSFLGNMVLYQLASPGWPIIWGTAGGVLDMRSGQYAGGPEAMLITQALVDMANFYNVPSATFGASSSEAKEIGYQTGLESMFGQLFSVLSNVDNIIWPTDLDGFALMDQAHMVLGKEAVRQAARVRQGMALDEEHLMADLIVKMKFSGEYIGDLTTKNYLQKEYSMSELFPRQTYEQWKKTGLSEDALAVAGVQKILGDHTHEQPTPEIMKELDRICRAAEKVLVK
jgi:trimethylamine--corrinoid protein Co-methyltransferase